MHTQARESRHLGRPDAHGIHTPRLLSDSIPRTLYMCFALCHDGDLCSEGCLSRAEEPHLSSARSVIQSYSMFNHTRTSGAVPDPDGGRSCARRPASCASCVSTYTLVTDGGPPGDVGVVTRWSMIVAVPRARARLGKDHFQRSASL